MRSYIGSVNRRLHKNADQTGDRQVECTVVSNTRFTHAPGYVAYVRIGVHFRANRRCSDGTAYSLWCWHGSVSGQCSGSSLALYHEDALYGSSWFWSCGNKDFVLLVEGKQLEGIDGCLRALLKAVKSWNGRQMIWCMDSKHLKSTDENNLENIAMVVLRGGTHIEKDELRAFVLAPCHKKSRHVHRIAEK